VLGVCVVILERRLIDGIPVNARNIRQGVLVGHHPSFSERGGCGELWDPMHADLVSNSGIQGVELMATHLGFPHGGGRDTPLISNVFCSYLNVQ